MLSRKSHPPRLLLLFALATAVACLGLAAQAENDLGPLMKPGEVQSGRLLLRSETGENMHAAPLLETDVEIAVTGLIERTSVRQRFENPTDRSLEAVYVFPLPERAAVDGMRIRVGERLIEGRIQERAQAKKTFEKAKREGRKASLLEQERPNLFTASLANLGPGESVEIEIDYQQELHYDQGRFTLRFPMAVAPRYIPGTREVKGFAGTGWALNTDQVPDAARITPPIAPAATGPINPLRLRVHLDAGFRLPHLASPSHDIRVSEAPGFRYAIELDAGRVPADRDFVLEWEPEIGNAPEAALFTEMLEGETYALLMVMPPPAQRVQSARLARETVFVVDTSGSMEGASIERARAALLLALDHLTPGDSFNVIQFNSDTYQLFPRAVPAYSGAVHEAKRYVQGLQAGGGTELHAALEAALADPGGGEDRSGGAGVRQVIFMTDGSVGNEAALFNYIHHNLGRSRLFTVGIGSAPNSHFMRKAASFGRGTFTYIASPEEIEPKMNELIEKIESPVLSDIELDWDLALNSEVVDAWPARVPDLYRGEPVVVALRVPELGGELRVRGRRGTEPWEIGFTLEGGREELGIDKLWARRKVASLMDDLHAGTAGEEIRATVTELGLRHHIVTRYTSLVAVDVTPTAPPGTRAAKAPVPTNLPAGWTMARPIAIGSLPRTATPAPLLLMLGLLMLGSAALALPRRGASSC